jgi:hypothetical protein
VRRAARTDANHSAIVQAFRDLGCSVLSLAAVGKGCPDLLIARPTKFSSSAMALIEVKDGSKKPSAQKLTEDQEKFHAHWKGRIFLCRSIVEVPGIVESLK